MKQLFFKLLALSCITILLSECSNSEKSKNGSAVESSVKTETETETEPKAVSWDTIKRIERVFMHTPWQYSFLARNNNNDTLYVNTFYHCNVRFVADVSPGEVMWALVAGDYNSRKWADGGYPLIVHIKSVEDVGGAGWQTGGKQSRDEYTSVVR